VRDELKKLLHLLIAGGNTVAVRVRVIVRYGHT
jgi:hypothetical protein